MATTLPALPYEASALEPYISANTLGYHHGKHHQTYVTNLNNLIQNTPLAEEALEAIIFASANVPEKVGIFNNAAQVWNHTFYWNCMQKNGGGVPTGVIAAKINEDFGSYDAFVEAFKNAGLTQFGSGWAWLVLENGKLKITKTSNADTPMVHQQKALLTVDVWEHAYYLDYQNKRADYIDIFLKYLVNWDFVNENLKA
ncbi:MAG: superoxide dismutase [Campylobacterales bacterium]|nr:superoxide dismutase [Campylobacterales bacterium]MBN2831968.1 superoxide dismutase [Campylobacterales bacterium]